MNILAKLFPGKSTSILREPHLWIIILLAVLITFTYYALQFFRPSIFERFPLAHSFVIWEYVHNLNGSLLYIPLLYFMVLFWWRGTLFSWRGALIAWFITMAIIVPRVLYLYNDNIARIFNNLFCLSFPLLAITYISLELELRKRERKRAFEKEMERQNYLAEVFKAEEDERKRISQEIHDDTIQTTLVLANRIQSILVDEEFALSPKTKGEMEWIQNTVLALKEDLRRLSLDLRPALLDDLGLVPALRSLVDGFKQENGINAQVKIIGEIHQLSQKYSVNIFRIIQEALNNVRRHSKATNVIVTLQSDEKAVKVIVQDNGKGFVLPKTSTELIARGKLGLIGMQQRAQFLNGTILILSEIGKGTTISLELGLAC